MQQVSSVFFIAYLLSTVVMVIHWLLMHFTRNSSEHSDQIWFRLLLYRDFIQLSPLSPVHLSISMPFPNLSRYFVKSKSILWYYFLSQQNICTIFYCSLSTLLVILAKSRIYSSSAQHKFNYMLFKSTTCHIFLCSILFAILNICFIVSHLHVITNSSHCFFSSRIGTTTLVSILTYILELFKTLLDTISTQQPFWCCYLQLRFEANIRGSGAFQNFITFASCPSQFQYKQHFAQVPTLYSIITYWMVPNIFPIHDLLYIWQSRFYKRPILHIHLWEHLPPCMSFPSLSIGFSNI